MSRHCNLDYAIKTLAKACNGIQHNSTGAYWGVIGKRIVSFRANGSDGACCFHTRRIDEEDDIQTDYFAGSFWSNLTRAIRYAKETEVK